jgi:hypothetical protein
MKAQATFLLLCSTVLLACCTNSSPKKAINTSTGQVLPKGFQCMLIPDGFFSPGYLYEVGQDGVSYALSFAFTGLNVSEADAGIPSIVLKHNAASEIGATYVNLGSAQLLYTDSNNMSFNFSDVKHLSTDSSLESAALEWLNSHQNVLKPGNRIFLIRDAYSAGQVKYNISKAAVGKIGGEAKIKQELITVNGKIYESSNGSDYALEQQFSPRVPVCFKSREIQYSTGLAGERQYEHAVDAILPDNIKSIRNK